MRARLPSAWPAGRIVTVGLQRRPADAVEVHGDPARVLGALGDNAVAAEYPAEHVVQQVVEGVVLKRDDLVLHGHALVQHHRIHLVPAGLQPRLARWSSVRAFLHVARRRDGDAPVQAAYAHHR